MAPTLRCYGKKFMDNNQNKTQQGGTGSAEQTGRNRDEQKLTNTSTTEKSHIASQIGEDENNITTISELGGMSGRDDASGGTGDRMETENTNEETGRP
jgi:hypothetical protein